MGAQGGEWAPSAQALSATMLLLDACLSDHHMPNLEKVAADLKSKGRACGADPSCGTAVLAATACLYYSTHRREDDVCFRAQAQKADKF